MGKFTISMAIFSSFFDITRGSSQAAPGRCTVQRGVVAEVGDPWHTVSWSVRGTIFWGNPGTKNVEVMKVRMGKIMLKWRFEWEKH